LDDGFSRFDAMHKYARRAGRRNYDEINTAFIKQRAVRNTVRNCVINE